MQILCSATYLHIVGCLCLVVLDHSFPCHNEELKIHHHLFSTQQHDMKKKKGCDNTEEEFQEQTAPISVQAYSRPHKAGSFRRYLRTCS